MMPPDLGLGAAAVFGAVPFTDAMIVRYVDDRLRSRVSGMRLAVSLGASSLAVWLIGPIVKAAGIDPVYFGVLFIINNSIGLVTPPVGTVLNVVAGVGRMRMDDVTRGVMPFMAVQFVVMFLMVMFPALVMVPARWMY